MIRVVKIGGVLVQDAAALQRIARWVAARPEYEKTVLVHGGGQRVAQLQSALGITPRKVAGMRVSDAQTMPLVEMALSGEANKRLVRALLAEGVDAVGLSGVDRGLLRCRPLEHGDGDLGFVGQIVNVRAGVLREAVEGGIVPVVSPVSLGMDGQAYNVNADDAAAAVAAALRAQLELVGDMPGVMVDGDVRSRLEPREAEGLIEAGIAHGGMVPKLRAAVRAVERGAHRARVIDVAGLEQGDGGTVIAPSGATSAPSPPAGHALDDDPPREGVRAGEEAAALIALDERVVLQTYRRPPIVFTHGEGAWLYDMEGRRYLDFHAGIAVSALGHSDPDWLEVVRQQAERLVHVSNLHYTPPYIRLAEGLVTRSFADRVFFCNSGGEAVEGALKLARKHARQRWAASGGAPEQFTRTGLVAFERAFHGRSAGALSMTHKPGYRHPFQPLLPEVSFVPFNDPAAAERAIDERTCAVFVEPVQGEGGYHPASLELLATLRRICDERGALLVLDEIQCGLGRTGSLWAYEHYGVEPDLMCVAKPLAGGLPIGAVLMTDEVASAIQPGDHGSTFAGGPLVCAAAEHVLERVSRPGFLSAVRQKGERLVEGLLSIEGGWIVDVRGAGLMIGVEMVAPVAPLVDALRERGVLSLAAGTHTLRLCPPLIVEQTQIDLFLDTLAACLADGVLAGDAAADGA